MASVKVSESLFLDDFCATSHSGLWVKNLELAKANLPKIVLLAKDLEKIAAKFGAKIQISSGVRCPEINKLEGGSPTSQHLKCEAVDFTLKGVDCEVIVRWVAKESGLKFGQVIHELKGSAVWVHYSLGEPYRDPARCRMALVFRMGKYEAFI